MEHDLRSVLEAAALALADVSQQPRLDAQLLLRHILGRDRAWLLAHGEERLTTAQGASFGAMIRRRLEHEPIQYILGEQEFYGLRLRVTPDVLIPRPETEHLVEAVLALMPRDRQVRIADIGTGSGAIALALAHALPMAEIDALDLSPAALNVAHANAQALGLAARVHFHHSDLLAAIAPGTCFNVIVANPPYIALGEQLEPQVAQWEPHMALFGGEQGLALYPRILAEAGKLLPPGGLIALEIGAGQREAIARMFALPDAPLWSVPWFVDDLQGIARVVLATRASR